MLENSSLLEKGCVHICDRDCLPLLYIVCIHWGSDPFITDCFCDISVHCFTTNGTKYPKTKVTWSKAVVQEAHLLSLSVLYYIFKILFFWIDVHAAGGVR